MSISKKIAIAVVFVIAFFLGYLFLARNPAEVQAPSEFRGPSGPPSVKGPEGLPPQ